MSDSPMTLVRDGTRLAYKFEEHGRKHALEVLEFPSAVHARRFVRVELPKLMNGTRYQVVRGTFPMAPKCIVRKLACPRPSKEAQS